MRVERGSSAGSEPPSLSSFPFSLRSRRYFTSVSFPRPNCSCRTLAHASASALSHSVLRIRSLGQVRLPPLPSPLLADSQLPYRSPEARKYFFSTHFWGSVPSSLPLLLQQLTDPLDGTQPSRQLGTASRRSRRFDGQGPRIHLRTDDRGAELLLVRCLLVALR